MISIIAFAGYKGSGKNTCADFLDGQQMSFAYKLKEVCHRAFPLGEKPKSLKDKEKRWLHPIEFDDTAARIIEEAYNVKISSKHKGALLESLRQVYQYTGTEVLRDIDSMIHCKHLVFKEGVNLVTDLRFCNEYCFLKGLGAEMYYVDRGLINVDKHASEAEIDYFRDLIPWINNRGSLNDLRRSTLQTQA